MILDFQSTVAQIQRALNDLPTLYPNLATVTESPSSSEFERIILVQFSPKLGDVPDIEEKMGNVLFNVTELQIGSPSSSGFQFLIENQPTPLFSFSDTQAIVSYSV